MSFFIRLEYNSMPLSEFPNKIGDLRLSLEELINKIFTNVPIGGDSIKDEFIVIIRVYPKSKFQNWPDFYKPVVRKYRKVKGALVTQDVFEEEIINEDEVIIFNRLLDCVINAVCKLVDLKVKDLKVDLLLERMEELRR